MSQIGQFSSSSVLSPLLTLSADTGTNPVFPDGGGDIRLSAGDNLISEGNAVLNTITYSLVPEVDTQSYSTLAGSLTEGWKWEANQLFAVGSDTDIDFVITPAGTGNLVIDSGTLQVAGFGLGAVLSDAFGQTSSANGTDGQLLIAGTGLIPAWADLTSTGSTITITPGANTLNIETAGTIADSFPTDAGTATPSAGELDILGGSNINTAGATNQVTVNLDNTVTISGSFSTTGGAVNVGTATPGNPYDIAIEQTVNGLIGQSIQNLSVGANAGVNLQMIGEPGTADLFNLYSVNGATTWSSGVDNSDSDSFKFTTGSSPSGGTEAVVLTTAGVVNFPQYSAGAILSTSAGVLSSDNGTAGQVLTANGAGVIPSWEDAPASFLPVVIGVGGTVNSSFQTAYWDELSTAYNLPGFPVAGDVGKIIEITCADSGGGTTVQRLVAPVIYYNGANYFSATAVDGGTITLRFISTIPEVFQVINLTGNWNFA